MIDAKSLTKAEKLIEYLYEINRLKFKIIKNIDEYKNGKVFWLCEIP